MGNFSAKQFDFTEPRLRKAEINVSIPINITLDGGFLVTHDLHQTPQDYKYVVVHQLMFEGKMAPFFKGLSEFDPSWSDKKIAQVVRQHLTIPFKDTLPLYTKKFPGGFYLKYVSKVLRSSRYGPFKPYTFRFRTILSLCRCLISVYKLFFPLLEVTLYRNSQECFICFLYYPKLNYTRCCSKPICSECFVQIKRKDPYITCELDTESGSVPILFTESASCPFCYEKDFGIIYFSSVHKRNGKFFNRLSVASEGDSHSTLRRYSSIHPLVVTSDMVRPHWYSQLVSAQRKIAHIIEDTILLNNLTALEAQYGLLKMEKSSCDSDHSLEENYRNQQASLRIARNKLFKGVVRLNLKGSEYADYAAAIREKELAAGKGNGRPKITLYDGTTITI